MLKSLGNIQSAFSLSRLYLICITIAFCGVCGYVIYSSYSFAEKQREKIYVLDQGKSLILAISQDVNQNRMAEARSHVKRFHEFFFTISPNKESITYNVGEALKMSDNSVLRQYQNMVENGFYDQLISATMSCEIRIDSVVVDETKYPFKAQCFAKTSIIRSSSVTFRNLQTSCELINCARSDDNPHGFIIENWKIIDNSDIKTVER